MDRVLGIASSTPGRHHGKGHTRHPERHLFLDHRHQPRQGPQFTGTTGHAVTSLQALAEGGASGFQVHEDMGAHARALDTALTVADGHDVQVALHGDTLNEALYVDDTLAVIASRTLHAFHVEGCGGGHAPSVLQLADVANIIGSSTNPGLPYTRATPPPNTST